MLRYNIIIGVYEPGGLGGCSPPDSGKVIIFRAKANFFGQKPAPKMKKNILSVFLKRKKTEFIPSSEIKCPKSGIVTHNYWVSRGRVILEVSIAVFFGADGSAPLEKNWPVHL